MNRISLLLIPFLCVSLQAQSTVLTRIGDKEARAHLLHGVDPVYPPIAKAAHVTGEVILDADVNADGNVTGMALVSGPPMLVQSAGAAVMGWKFSPFQVDGKTSAVTVELKLAFPTLEPRPETKVDEKVAESFFRKKRSCTDAVENKSWPKATELCKEAITIANDFPEEAVRALEIEQAHEAYGQALVGSGHLDDALNQFQTAAKMARVYLYPWNYARALYLCAATEALMGNEAAANSDYSIAENSYREAVTKAPWMTAANEHSLAEVLVHHASLADKMGKTSEATEMREEATKADRKVKIKDASAFPEF